MSARGFSRFRGGGSLWKTSWRGRIPYTEMCCIEGFGDQFYLSNSDLMPLDFVGGSWFAVVVGITSPPAVGTWEGIARGSAAGSGAWDLSYTSNAGGGLLFRLRLNVGLPSEMTFASTVVVVGDPQEYAALGYEVFYRIFVQAVPVSGGAPNGSIAMWAEGQNVAPVGANPLSDPYSAASPATVLGLAAADTQALQAPNCIHGAVAGASSTQLDPLNAGGAATPFFADIEEQFQITSPPPFALDGSPAAGFAVLNGWRANNPALPVGNAPASWLPYEGADALAYGNPEGGVLTVMCGQAVFAQDV